MTFQKHTSASAQLLHSFLAKPLPQTNMLILLNSIAIHNIKRLFYVLQQEKICAVLMLYLVYFHQQLLLIHF